MANVRVGERALEGSVGKGANVKTGRIDADDTEISLPSDTEALDSAYVIDSEINGANDLERTANQGVRYMSSKRTSVTWNLPSGITSALLSLEGSLCSLVW